jgi:hypothetical protein
MNEKPGLWPGFFFLGYALLPVPTTCLSCHFGVGLAGAWKRAQLPRRDPRQGFASNTHSPAVGESWSTAQGGSASEFEASDRAHAPTA